MNRARRKILWWGRFDAEYSRNRILRLLLAELGYQVHDFQPKVSALGSLEALFTRLPEVDAVWVPCFRQRDFCSAYRFSQKRKIPLIFDPLISSWDKAVFERKKFAEDDRRSHDLKRWEESFFNRSDLILADTDLHAGFFIKSLGAAPQKTFVVPVGAEEDVFTRQAPSIGSSGTEVLFYGSFIHLQGPTVIAEAAKLVPNIEFTFLGDGPLKGRCREITNGLANVRFEEWIPYETLPGRIGRADILLGVFGDSLKAGRVIPNKVYQALACGRPVITRFSEAFPKALQKDQPGLRFVPPSSPEKLAEVIVELAEAVTLGDEEGNRARMIYEDWFSYRHIKDCLQFALRHVI